MAENFTSIAEELFEPFTAPIIGISLEANAFTVTEVPDIVNVFRAGISFQVYGSPANNGWYTVDSASGASGTLTVVVLETIPNSAAGGRIARPALFGNETDAPGIDCILNWNSGEAGEPIDFEPDTGEVNNGKMYVFVDSGVGRKADVYNGDLRTWARVPGKNMIALWTQTCYPRSGEPNDSGVYPNGGSEIYVISPQ